METKVCEKTYDSSANNAIDAVKLSSDSLMRGAQSQYP